MAFQSHVEPDFHDQAVLDSLERQGRAGADFVIAVKAARRACEEAGLNATFDDENIPSFSTEQTARAVRFTREDASAALFLQMHIMRRLDRNKNFMWAIIGLLLYIAWKLK